LPSAQSNYASILFWVGSSIFHFVLEHVLDPIPIEPKVVINR
jgi:hypothetical protein